MGRMLKKAVAFILTAVLFLLPCSAVSFAEESPDFTEETEAEDQAQAEAEAAAQAAAEEAARAESERIAAEEAAAQAEAEEAARIAAEAAAAQAEAEAAAQAAAEEAARAESEAAAQAEAEAAARAESERLAAEEAAAQAAAEEAARAESEAAAQAEAEAAAQAEAEAAAQAAAEAEAAAAQAEAEAAAQAEAQAEAEAAAQAAAQAEAEAEAQRIAAEEAAAQAAAESEGIVFFEAAGQIEPAMEMESETEDEEKLGISVEFAFLDHPDSDEDKGEEKDPDVLAANGEQIPYYIALFTDENCENRVIFENDEDDGIKEVSFDGETKISQSVEFDLTELTEEKYYAALTDEDGTPLENTKPQEVSLEEGEQEGNITLQFVFPEIPDGFSFCGTLKIKKKVVSGDKEKDVTDTFCFGLSEEEDNSEELSHITKLEFDNESSNEVEIVILLPETGESVDYYVVEVDAEDDAEEDDKFKPVEEVPDFPYVPDFSDKDNQDDNHVTISKNEVTELTVTNVEKPDGQPESETETESPKTDNSITISANFLYKGEPLTANRNQEFEIALCEDASGTNEVERQELVFTEDHQLSEGATFNHLEAGTYYAILPDREDVPFQQVEVGTFDHETVTFSFNDSYPDGFSWEAYILVEMQVLGHTDEPMETDETFYVMIYSDSEREEAVLSSPLSFPMNGESEQTTEGIPLTLASESQTFYLGETDASGNRIDTQEFPYSISYQSEGEVTVECGQDEEASGTVINKLNDTVVNLRITDASESTILSESSFAVKDAGGSIISGIYNGEASFVNSEDLVEGETYYLYEINAEDGYKPAPALAFTVERGVTRDYVLVNSEIDPEEDDCSLTVSKAVFVGEDQLYAYNTSAVFYFALFSDADRTEKVSNVMGLQMKQGFTADLTFENLSSGELYYVAETDENGIALSSTSEHSISCSPSNVTVTGTDHQVEVKNVYASYSDLPDSGFRYTGMLNITKDVTDSSGDEKEVTGTFYAGIYTKEDYSDSPTIVSFSFEEESSVTISRRILLSGNGESVTYYIAEVEEDGTRITDSSSFEYEPSYSTQSVTISPGGSETVSITNKAKEYRATLYLTKEVYDGSTALPVNETFYAGLFKDKELTELYTSPVAISMGGSSEKTLKLTLNLGSSPDATIYVAEVNASGEVIRDYRDFGYNIEIGNAAASFTESEDEVQSVIGNFVYGTTTESQRAGTVGELYEEEGDDDFTLDENGDIDGVDYYDYYNSGYNSDGYNYYDGEEGENGTVAVSTGTGTTGTGTGTGTGTAEGTSASTSSVQTGDDTPLFIWIVLMGAALAVFGWSLRRRAR